MARPGVRVAAAASALVLLLAVAVGYVAHAAHRGGSVAIGAVDTSGKAASPAGDVRAVTSAGPFYLFKSSALDRDFGRLVAAPASDPSRRVFVAGVRCNRVGFAAGHGLCLQLSAGVPPYVDASILDANLAVTGHVKLPGYPSRVRVSPDGALAAATTFVSGDTYATIGFSTRTSIIDLRTGQVLLDLEKLTVTKDARSFHASDVNFWGVTFESDSRHFYATVGSGGQTYLIHGDVRGRSATVVTTGVECPSLSPDGRQIAFKKRVPGEAVAWRLWILDLATGRQHATAETRLVDDQPAWLDDRTVMYGLPVTSGDQAGDQQVANSPPAVSAGASIDTDMWAVPAAGGGSPRLVLAHAWSAQSVG